MARGVGVYVSHGATEGLGVGEGEGVRLARLVLLGLGEGVFEAESLAGTVFCSEVDEEQPVSNRAPARTPTVAA